MDASRTDSGSAVMQPLLDEAAMLLSLETRIQHYAHSPLPNRYDAFGNHPLEPLLERSLFVISLSMCCHNESQQKEVHSCPSLTYPG